MSRPTRFRTRPSDYARADRGREVRQQPSPLRELLVSRQSRSCGSCAALWTPCRFSKFDPRLSGSDSDRQRHRPAHGPRQRCAWAPDHAVSPPGPPSLAPALSAVSDAPWSCTRSGRANHPTNPLTSRWLTLAAGERPIPQRSWRRTRVSPRNAVVPACAFSLSDRPLPPLLSQNRESVSHAQPAPAVW
jgi:hypothetical protein